MLPLLLALLVAGCGLPGTVAMSGKLAPAPPAPTPTPLPPVRFPQDEAPHHDLTEWWYYTGHLKGTDAHGQQHEYGFELTFFQTLRGGIPPYFAAHFAVSDITRGTFQYDQATMFGNAAAIPPAGSTTGFNLKVGQWTMQGLDGHDQLSASMANYTMQLALTDHLPHPILEGGNGLISYGQSGFSYYYSRPLMAITGMLNDHGTALHVTGQAWMDHQWGNFVSLADAGWDWISIQLANHTEYMLYVIRNAQKQPVSVVGTAVAANGQATEIPASAIHVQATGSWTSPHTGGVYPSGWRITVDKPALDVTLAPALRDQELVTTQSTGLAYWEGAVGISGTASGKPVSGQGYVELTGYAQLPPSQQFAP